MKYYEIDKKYQKYLKENVKSFLRENKEYSQEYLFDCMCFSKYGKLLGFRDDRYCFYIVNNDNQLLMGKNKLTYVKSLENKETLKIFFSQELFNNELSIILKERKKIN